MNKRYLFFLFIIVLGACAPLRTFHAAKQPTAPDYSLEKNWSALPFRTDAADMIPNTEIWTSDSLKQVDVFYVYPTLYVSGLRWNENLNNHRLNHKIDKYPVRYQASVFNQVGRVYAPRYRQARLDAFIDTKGNGEKALEFAYQDVERAFEYFLEHYNHGRPIIIASHSQGTWICRKLIKDYFDAPEKKEKLVCAYIIGYEVDPSCYEVLTPCDDPGETNCFVTWSSFKSSYAGTGLKSHTMNQCSINPVSWRTDSTKAESVGGILFDPNEKVHYKTEAFVAENNLWLKTNAPFFKHLKNLHILDYNLFWFDIRANVKLRTEEYLKSIKSEE